MTVDQQRLRQFAPFALPVIILAAGWILLVRPASAEKARTARQLDALRPRLESVRRSLMEPLPPPLTIEPAKSFERQVTSGGPGRLLEELSRLAPRGRYRRLSIDATGEQGEVRLPSGPQLAGGPQLDPRLWLFSMPLTYVPITMSFDASYADAGELLWRLRDLATLVEIRSLQVARPAVDDGASAAAASASDVHVTLTLFAYARVPDVVRASSDGAVP